MVDVGSKPDTCRRAKAQGQIAMSQETLDAIAHSRLPKGDVLSVAKTAGIMAAKQTSNLLPLCHPLPISDVSIQIEQSKNGAGLVVHTSVGYTGKTGVEMEALTACATALLTIYDMAKGEEKGMTIRSIRLVEKEGGESGHWKRGD